MKRISWKNSARETQQWLLKCSKKPVLPRFEAAFEVESTTTSWHYLHYDSSETIEQTTIMTSMSVWKQKDATWCKMQMKMHLKPPIVWNAGWWLVGIPPLLLTNRSCATNQKGPQISANTNNDSKNMKNHMNSYPLQTTVSTTKRLSTVFTFLLLRSHTWDL